MEANPGTLTKKNLSAYKDAGINRLSMGLQSADNSCLYLLGRIHTWEEFLKNYELAGKAGFDNACGGRWSFGSRRSKYL